MNSAEHRLLEIASIPGDGIGGEVLDVGRSVIDTVESITGTFSVSWTTFPWGSGYYERTGTMMDAGGVDQLRSFDAIYFGAVGWPTVPDHVTLWGLRLAIVQQLDLWANVRPVSFLPGIHHRLSAPGLEGTSWITVRENSEGEYSGIGGRNFAGRGPAGEIAIETSVFTQLGCERIIRYAFELARKQPVRHVTSVTKSNAQRYGMVLWDETFARIAEQYPDVTTDSCLVDAMAARMVLSPQDLSVVVGSNLHGDILSDLGSALSGGLGMGHSANLNPERRSPSMFEPVHGSAPDIAARNVANPFGAVLSGAMMLDHLDLRAEADLIRDAVRQVAASGCLTPDLGGVATTDQVCLALLDALDGAVHAGD